MRKSGLIRIVAILVLFIGIISIVTDNKTITGNSILETNKLLSFLSKNNIYGLILILSSAILLFGVQLEERVQGADTKPSDEDGYFYHATTTGESGEHLESFLGSGARVDIAQGHGQGKGFYVWRGRGKAVHHATQQIKLEEERPGKLMLVKVKGEYNPADWNIDYEANAGLVAQFVYENFDKFKEMGDLDIPSSLDHAKTKIMPSRSRVIVSPKDKSVNLYLAGIGGFGIKNSDSTQFLGDDYGIQRGAYLSYLMQRMQKQFPDLVRKFEEENLRKVDALKYVGREPLKVEGIELMDEDRTWKEHKR